MCLVTTTSHLTFEDEQTSYVVAQKASSWALNHQRLPLSAADFLHQARAITVGILITAYLAHHAPEAKSITNLNLSFFTTSRPSMDGWWVVAYALVAYTMFGSRRWLIQRQFSRISKATSQAFQQVASTEALTNIRSTVSMRSIHIFGHAHDDKLCGKRSLSLSLEDSFVNDSHVASLTLRDVSEVFRYVFESGSIDFDYKEFVSDLSDPARLAIEKLEIALLQSRGERVSQHQQCPKTSEFGSVDALAFVGACRIFAEWMPIRLVPDGYGRYAFGMGIGRRDMIGNIAKVEKAVHAFFDAKVPQAQGGTVGSPSLREILEYEVAENMHQHRPKVANNTAAQGLLWLKRQLQYQTTVFSNSCEIPYRFPTDKSAARAAYEEVYGPYHGFFVKQVFQSSFDAAPSFNEILLHMNIPGANDTRSRADTADNSFFTATEEEDEDDTWIQLSVDRDSIRPISVAPEDRHENPFLNFIGNAVRDNIMKLGQCIGCDGHGHPSLNVMAPVRESPSFIASDNVDKTGIDKDVSTYLFTLKPFLCGLDNLIHEFSMNDPSRV